MPRRHRERCGDRSRGWSHLEVLFIGAQTIRTPLTASNPGAKFTNRDVRVPYQYLVSVLRRYVDGYARCERAPGVIVIATNTSGEYVQYTASAKGADWASRVIAPLADHAGTASRPVSVAGGIDIEAGFEATAVQAKEWEIAYLEHTTADLINIGSADGCPTIPHVVGQACGSGSTSGRWTQDDYYNLSRGISPQRLSVLPQIYFPVNATQWANIEESGASQNRWDGTGDYYVDHLFFRGALTLQAGCAAAGSGCTSISPAEAWTALSNAVKAERRAAAFPNEMSQAADLGITAN